MNFLATKVRVFDRGVPPDDFLEELVVFGKSAPDEIFDPNDVLDIYSVIEPQLGPWRGLQHRRAAMLEALRVLAGFESSWNWDEGVDTTNPQSIEDIACQEAGIFQVSYNSLYLDPGTSLNDCLIAYNVGPGAEPFIDAMKANHALAIEYCARLLRISIEWDGPILDGGINAWLSPAAVAEFQSLIA